MPEDLYDEWEDTPNGRLMKKFVDLIDKLKMKFYRTGAGAAFPDRADIREGMRLYVQREMLRSNLDLAKQHCPLTVRVLLQKQLDDVNWQIAKKENQE